jgi:hypothetical protein
MKKCIKCLVDKTTYDFREYEQGKYLKACIECNKKQANEWIKNNKEKKTKSNYEYNNSLRGFLVNAFNQIIKRSRKRKNRKSVEVKLTRKQFFEEFLLHYERFGMNCRYTGAPLTTISNRGSGQITITQTNLSVDRIDNSLPYQVDNIVFCTHEFNNRKGSVRIDDCKKILKVYEERKLELKEDGYHETQS